ncbi:LuxR family transcriptional regulator [Burkholderia glumae]|uniref:LuxR family transcriptional regulator n=1 Tax=Burkholderia glumae TaxID=337 RepID=A0AAP9Y3N4_BURGL|nr:LuxR family transcriptional regulator [Burkholderia glumae]ACR28238.1 Acylhomoserine lactone dependent transcriptional activator [Burkholderia glumae BGR1]AJY67223.1 bacterial regulatory s, luxR family protein [Burkholderia glumae LMG 2196 = ATCC 33617]KHJ64228.1 acyl-homoserine-lactone acylase [Burkholderia glumae]MCM2480770.1 LuxR family transcriptional regulator [Burkholderia glumae]MCM2492543.1 LuxR family transcriptional regulator [Burkholderia glumae]
MTGGETSKASPSIRLGEDPSLAVLIEHLPAEIDCPFAYVMIDKNSLELGCFLSSYPIRLQQEYRRRALHRVDPVVLHAIQSVAPFSWAEAFRQQRVPDPSEFDALRREFGLHDGYVFTVHDPYQYVGMLSFFNRGGRPEFRAEIERVKGAMQLALVLFHSRINAKPPDSRHRVESLTLRERTVLKWAAMGKSYSEIADICGIRERTVKYHMANVVQKLDVSTAKQAVIVASRLGLAALSEG